MRSKKDINIRIGANIQAVRERANYTQEQLSEMIGVTPNHLSAIERGASGASLETIEKLCKFFGVSADYLFFGERAQSGVTEDIAAQLSHINPEYYPQIKKIHAALIELVSKQELDKN